MEADGAKCKHLADYCTLSSFTRNSLMLNCMLGCQSKPEASPTLSLMSCRTYLPILDHQPCKKDALERCAFCHHSTGSPLNNLFYHLPISSASQLASNSSKALSKSVQSQCTARFHLQLAAYPRLRQARSHLPNFKAAEKHTEA